MLMAVGNYTGSYPIILTSSDAITWTQRNSIDAGVGLNAVCYSPSLLRWVVVGAVTGGQALIMTSDNGGVSWTQRDNPKALDLRGVAWSPTLDLFVACGLQDGDAYLISSPDGITWTERANARAKHLYSIAWGLDRFVAIGHEIFAWAQAYKISSTDGINWVDISEGGIPDAKASEWEIRFTNNDLFMIGGYGLGDQAQLCLKKSIDGITWDFLASGILRDVASAPDYGAGIYVWGTARSAAFGTIITSTDLAVFVANDTLLDYSIYSVVYSESLELFVAVGGYKPVTPIAYIITSPDGLNWTQRVTPLDFSLVSICEGGLQMPIFDHHYSKNIVD